MRRPIFLSLIAIAGLVTGLALVGYFRNTGAEAGCQYVPGSLSNASIEQLEANAKNYACVWLSPNGEMKTRFAKFMTTGEYMSHFGENARLCRDEALAVVILQGDFGWNLPGLGQLSEETRQKNARGSFVGMVFDVKSGQVFQTTRSGGSAFREILDDPSLPENTVQLVPTLASLPPCIENADFQPTLMPPSTR